MIQFQNFVRKIQFNGRFAQELQKVYVDIMIMCQEIRIPLGVKKSPPTSVQPNFSCCMWI